MNEFLESLASWSLFPVIKAVLIVVIGAIIIHFAKQMAARVLSKTKIANNLLDKFILNAIKVVLWVLVLMMVLSALGVESTSVVTVLAAGGAAVALALQGSLSNLASGILLMTYNIFEKGDYVEANGTEGTVESIDMFHTTIITADNKTVTIPNGGLTGGNIINYTKRKSRRMDISVSVAYDSDLEKVRRVLKELAAEDSRVLKNPAPFAAVSNYADSGIEVFLRIHCNASDYWDVKFDLQNAIKPRFDREGIEIPFMQIEVKMK